MLRTLAEKPEATDKAAAAQPSERRAGRRPFSGARALGIRAGHTAREALPLVPATQPHTEAGPAGLSRPLAPKHRILSTD